MLGYLLRSAPRVVCIGALVGGSSLYLGPPLSFLHLFFTSPVSNYTFRLWFLSTISQLASARCPSTGMYRSENAIIRRMLFSNRCEDVTIQTDVQQAIIRHCSPHHPTPSHLPSPPSPPSPHPLPSASQWHNFIRRDGECNQTCRVEPHTARGRRFATKV